MRLIDADKIDYYKVERNGMELYMVWKGHIDNMPTIDAVPVVRCKDCKWWGLSSHNTFDIHICKRHNGVRFESDFCSRAERSEDEKH